MFAKSGNPAVGYDVELRRFFSGFPVGSYIPLAHTVTDSRGEFEFEVHLDGRYDVDVGPRDSKLGNGGIGSIQNLQEDAFLEIEIWSE